VKKIKKYFFKPLTEQVFSLKTIFLSKYWFFEN